MRRPVTLTVVFVSTGRAFVRRRQWGEDLATTVDKCDKVRIERLELRNDERRTSHLSRERHVNAYIYSGSSTYSGKWNYYI